MTTNNENKYKELLQVGQVFKNYKALCEHLGEEAKNSNAKKAQIRDWERYFNYTKSGHKITIKELFKTPKNKIDNRKGGNNTVDYIEKIEFLILNMLVRKEEGSVFLSKNKLLKALSLLKEDYLNMKYKQGELSKLLQISKEEIIDFYQTSDAVIYRNIETALKNLRKKALLVWNSEMTIVYIETEVDINEENEAKAVKKITVDSNGDEQINYLGKSVDVSIEHRKATPEEKNWVIDAEYGMLASKGYETPRDAFLEGKLQDFYDDVTDYLFDKFNISMYYDSYEISYVPENIADYLNKNYSNCTDVFQVILETNKSIIDRLSENAKRRNKTALDKSFGVDYDKRKVRLRASKKYLKNQKILTEELIQKQ